MKSKATGKTPQAQGIGESRLFIDPATAHDESPLLDLHVGGQRVRDMAERLGTDWLRLLTYHHTDEGIAERNAGRADAAARVTAGPEEKAAMARRDFRSDEGNDHYFAPDPLKDTAAPHGKPGFRQRYLSPAKIQNAGTRGWQPVIDGKGDNVRHGNLILAEMPEERAQKRAEAIRRRTEDLQQSVKERFEEQTEQPRGAKRPGWFRGAPDPDKGLHIERGEAAAYDHDE